MNELNRENRISAFIRLGESLRESFPESVLKKAQSANPWFTPAALDSALASLSGMLEEKKLKKWISAYSDEPKLPAEVIVILAGNIPLVGFHDFLSVLISGHYFKGKLSADDEFLLPEVARQLTKIEPGFKNRISFFEPGSSPLSRENQTGSRRAYITTGSNQSAAMFEYYFKRFPHLIRRHRNSVAVLTGQETTEEMQGLGRDIFQYFGLGCRNVSKVYLPQDYNTDLLFASLVDFGDVIHHHKYHNNYQYHRSIFLLNGDKFLDNNFLLLKESPLIASPVGTLFFERYSNPEELEQRLEGLREQIQCIVGHPFGKTSAVPFGRSQAPELWDYADGADTMKFLAGIK